MRKLRSIIAVASSLVAFCGAANAAIVANGDFETGDFSGWTVNAGGDAKYPQVVIPYNSSANYPNGAFGLPVPSAPGGGNFGAYFVSDKANQSISQSVSLTAGTTYVVSYYLYAPANGRANTFDAQLQSATDGFLSPVWDAKTLGSGWTLYTAHFVADASPSYTISLDFHPDGIPAADFVVDNVSLTAAVPEPATWAMMVLGFAGIGLLGYRRSQKAQFRLV